jgi:hypothetical protein
MEMKYGDFKTTFRFTDKSGELIYKFTTWRVDNAEKAARFLGKKLETGQAFSTFELMRSDDAFARRRIRLLTDILDNGIDPDTIGSALVALTNIQDRKDYGD